MAVYVVDLGCALEAIGSMPSQICWPTGRSVRRRSLRQHWLHLQHAGTTGELEDDWRLLQEDPNNHSLSDPGLMTSLPPPVQFTPMERKS